ncbi:vWA domain-containing protein [Paenibacillus sp. NPDC056579]|uniref:vWA domain-containing protein n=1 Tax=Paenibacillus sp. NPDC056579 TaxID=3345871 RepID=UPI0036BC0190
MRFVENEVDAFLRMQLLDLAKALTGIEDLGLELSYLSYYNHREKLLAVSQFWSYYPEEIKLTGMKTDVYLRGIGSSWFTDSTVIASYLDWIKSIRLPMLAKQWLALCEERRLMSLCLRHRPGTASSLSMRSAMYAKHFAGKRASHSDRGEQADALLSGFAEAIYRNRNLDALEGLNGLLAKLPGDARPAIERLLIDLKNDQFKSTQELAERCKALFTLLDDWNGLGGDSRAQYFSLQKDSGTDEPLSWEYIGELKRKKKGMHESVLPMKQEEERPQQGERLPTWHRETKKQEESLLRFDSEQGSKAGLLSDHVREADSGDQALGIVQGSSQAAQRNEPELPATQPLERMDTGLSGKADAYGALNRKAVPVFRPAEPPDADAYIRYNELHKGIAPLIHKLKQTIRMTMEQKRIAPRDELLSGRLSRKLVRAAWEPFPRLFYKKSSPSTEVDAAFCLLIDCSASMYDKMEQAHQGIALFHESLRALRVPHEIIGFWEDADEVTESSSPNVFHVVTDYISSLTDSAVGPKLLQLQAEQDNRDGYAIRIASERLMLRPEKQKVLLVFSDGEPSAADYHEEGIVDTCEAVLRSRRSGIEVVSVFLGNGEIKDTERETMRNIYGRHSVLVPDVADITAQLGPLLRKMLLSKL